MMAVGNNDSICAVLPNVSVSPYENAAMRQNTSTAYEREREAKEQLAQIQQLREKVNEAVKVFNGLRNKFEGIQRLTNYNGLLPLKTYDFAGSLTLTMERGSGSTLSNGTSSSGPSTPDNVDDDQNSIDTSSNNE